MILTKLKLLTTYFLSAKYEIYEMIIIFSLTRFNVGYNFLFNLPSK